MSKKANIFFPLSLLLFLIVEFFLIQSGLFVIGVLFYLIYAAILYSNDKKYIIALLVFQLPLLPVIPDDFKLVGLLGPHEIVYGFSYFVLFTWPNIKKVKLK